MIRNKWVVILLLFLFSSSFADNAKKPKIGLVLSGGGAKGFAHIGVLKVLEELEITPDYITGTSMGSIVGGLYAIGYSAEHLENLALTQNWSELFLDQISRKDISITEKEQDSKYAGTFEFKDFNIVFPTGLLNGHKLSALISRLTWSVHHVDDFNNFSIPFKCIAADIETGEAVVLDHGFLPDAIRASMAIPSVFTPIELDNRLLVDGGIIRNFPVTDAIDMGADITIGVDVGAPLLPKEDLNSLVKIINQAINFKAVASTKEQRKLCDFLITPELRDFTIMSFEDVEAIIARGEQAARSIYPQLKQLADSLKFYHKQEHRHIPAVQIKEIYIHDVKILGLSQVSRQLVLGKLMFPVPGTITPDELEQAISRIYGSHFFERVTYKFEPTQEGMHLIINVIEKSTDMFRFGINYNSQFNASLLLNTTFRNLLGHGSKLLLDMKFGANQGLGIAYYYYTNWNPGLGIGIELTENEYDFKSFENHKTTAAYDKDIISQNLVLESVLSNSICNGVVLQTQETNLEAEFSFLDKTQNLKMDYFNIYGYLKFDTFDHADFPKTGIQLYAEAKKITNMVSEDYDENKISFERYFISFEKATAVHKKYSLLNRLVVGAIHGNNVPYDQQFFFGGIVQPENYIFPFWGMDFMEHSAKNFVIAGLGMQYELRQNVFVQCKINGAKKNEIFENLFHEKGIHWGGGIALGIDFPIGPLTITFEKSKYTRGFNTFVNLGHYF